jgi:hypothetical protein
MSKIYFIRHQAAGILDGLVFSSPPSAEILEKVGDAMRARHGFGHPKYNDPKSEFFKGENHPCYGQPWVVSVEERELDDLEGFLASIAPSTDAGASTGAKSDFPVEEIKAFGEVKNP